MNGAALFATSIATPMSVWAMPHSRQLSRRADLGRTYSLGRPVGVHIIFLKDWYSKQM